MDEKKIGQFLRELRINAGMSQMDLADKLYLTRNTVSRYEMGMYLPSADVLVKLSEIFNISINEILAGKRLDEKDYNNYANKNLVNILDYKDKEITKYKKLFKLLFWIIFIYGVGTIPLLIELVDFAKEKEVMIFICLMIINFVMFIIANYLNNKVYSLQKEKEEILKQEEKKVLSFN